MTRSAYEVAEAAGKGHDNNRRFSREEMLRLDDMEMPIRAIAERLGVSRQTVSRALSVAGRKRRPGLSGSRRPPHPESTIADVRRLDAEGHSQAAIGRLLNLSANAVAGIRWRNNLCGKREVPKGLRRATSA